VLFESYFQYLFNNISDIVIRILVFLKTSGRYHLNYIIFLNIFYIVLFYLFFFKAKVNKIK
jgi:hypothetical protein